MPNSSACDLMPDGESDSASLEQVTASHPNDRFQGFCCTVQGHSHKKDNRKCQDASEYLANNDFGIAVVSDGHGSSRHFRSDVGANLAVACALRQVKAFICSSEGPVQLKSDHDKSLRGLEENIIYTWREAVLRHFEENPLTEAEEALCAEKKIPKEKPVIFYGATLLFSAITPAYAFAAKIGDGSPVFLKKDGTALLPVPEDEKLFGNFTTSLCDEDAIDNFRHHFSEESLDAIFLSTDGVVNSYAEEGFLNFNREILLQMRKDHEVTKKELELWLPQLSERGSGDDMSIAGIYCLETKEEVEMEAVPEEPGEPQRECGEEHE